VYSIKISVVQMCTYCNECRTDVYSIVISVVHMCIVL